MGRRRRARLFLCSLLLGLLLAPPQPLRADDGGEPAPGTAWRWRDERGQIHLTDNPESIPQRFRGTARAIPPLVRDDEADREPAVPLGAVGTALRKEGPGGVPLSTVAVVASEVSLVRLAASVTGLAIDLPGIAIACAAAAFVRWLDLPLVSSLGSFAVLLLLLAWFGRAEGPETVALFLVVVALIHAGTLWMLWKLAAAQRPLSTKPA